MTSKEKLQAQISTPAARRRIDNDRALIATGTVGALLAAICCATPLLAVLLGVIGLTAWVKEADYVLIPVLFLCLLLIGLGLYRRRYRQDDGLHP